MPAKMNRGERLSASVPTLQVDTQTDKDRKTVVDIAVQIGGLALENLEANGAEIIDVVPSYNHVRARVSLDQMEKIAALPEVQSIRPKGVMILLRTSRESGPAEPRGSRSLSPDLAERAGRIRTYLSGAIPKFAASNSSVMPVAAAPVTQGDVTNKATTARSTFGINSSGTERSFLFYQFDTALSIRIRTTDLLGRYFREFRAKVDEIGALPSETICQTAFSLIVGRYHPKRNRDENNRFPVANTSPD
jgi:hypothetical protein